MSGSPPLASFQPQAESSLGSLEPPPVKMLALFAVPSALTSLSNDRALAWSFVARGHNVGETVWQTRSQSSGRPAVRLSVLVGEGDGRAVESASSSNTPLA